MGSQILNVCNCKGTINQRWLKLVRTGGSRHTGQAAPPHQNIHLHFRSALRHSTDSSFTIFSYTLNTMAFDHSTYKCFAISTCMAIAEGLPPSQKEHCLNFYLKVVAFRTHYVINYYCPRWTASYSVCIGLRHLYQHIIGGFFITPCNASAYTIRPSIAGGLVFSITFFHTNILY